MTPCPAELCFIRQCALPAQAILWFPKRDHGRQSCPSVSWSTTAAAGYSYGNQIGLATGQVDEIVSTSGYVAKRMEIGAVVGAAPASNVRREVPAAGDIVVLLGGATGRDGCGGATGSSKAHKLESVDRLRG